MSTSSSDWLPLVALILEPIGVFLLSVEAIKISNLERVRMALTSPYNRLNPRILTAKEGEEKGSDPPVNTRSCIGAIVWFPVFILIYSFVATPFIILFYCTMKLLKRIEDHTQTGVIGLLGFALWFLSFVINRNF